MEKKIECPDCKGTGGYICGDDWGFVSGAACDLCRGAGEVPASWMPPEEPPLHTDADAPQGVEPTAGYCPLCLCEAPRCTCEDEVDENALREARGLL
jgi:hypothetical protein